MGARFGRAKARPHRAELRPIPSRTEERPARIGRQGEVRDRSSVEQHLRMVEHNPLAAIVIDWDTVRLGDAVRQRQRAGLPVEPNVLAHISPRGWAHILLTGEYRRPRKR